MSVHKLLPLLALLLNVLLIGSALTGDRKSHRHYVFALLAGALAVWNLGVFGLRGSGDPATALTWERFLHYGVILIPVLFYHYVLAFLDQPRRNYLLIGGYAICGGFLAVCSTGLFMRGVIETSWGYMPLSGPLYPPFFLYLQAYIVLGLVRLLRAYPTLTSSFRRNRTKLVVGGVIASLLGGLVDFVRYILGWDWLYPLGIPSNAVFALALGLAIVRYRLLDLGMVAKWAILYMLTAATMGPVLIGAIYGVDVLVPGVPFTPDLRYIVAIALAVAVALPLLRKLEGRLERLMFAREHGVRDTLMALSKQMASILDLETLGRSLTDGLVARVPLMHASLYLPAANGSSFALLAQALSSQSESPPLADVDDVVADWLRLAGKPLQAEEWAQYDRRADHHMVSRLEAARVALALPLFAQGELAGVLLLGEKVSGGPISSWRDRAARDVDGADGDRARERPAVLGSPRSNARAHANAAAAHPVRQAGRRGRAGGRRGPRDQQSADDHPRQLRAGLARRAGGGSRGQATDDHRGARPREPGRSRATC